MWFFEVFSLDGCGGPDFFVPGDAFIVGGVEERLKTDIIRSSLFGIEDFSFFDDYVYDV
jgi:hypothetical protein